MEQYSQYLMLVKSKNNIYMNRYSWEEEAFAEDGRGPLVWPPRSYPCSFCRREFRSAQALGGHMNVHRREKAKLKQTHASATTIAPQQHKENLDCNSDTKSCVYDDHFVDVETNLFLGFDLDSWSNTVSDCKRRKTSVTPSIMAGSMDGLDLELRLASLCGELSN